MASALPFFTGFILRRILNPSLSDRVPKLGQKGQYLEPLFHNTVNPTIVHGGEKINVIPSEIVLELDGRLLPGFGPEDMITELHQIIGDEVELEVMHAYLFGLFHKHLSKLLGTHLIRTRNSLLCYG